MGLLSDAVDLLSSGKTLQATALSGEQAVMVLSPSAEGGYQIHDVAQRTPLRSFARPTSAVRTFYRLVGASGLDRSVSDLRYRALFPVGSSLEWPPIPLQEGAPARETPTPVGC